jgi:hypothetical protein
MIRTLSSEETVTEPGAYRMPLERYHTQAICPGPSVSSSGLRTIANESPHAFWRSFEGNPNRYPPRDPNPSMILGRAAHALILGDEVFRDVFAVVPEDAPSRPTKTQVAAFERTGKWSPAAAEGAAWWELWDAQTGGKTLIPAKDVITIGYMAENLAACPEAMEALTSDLIEVSMIWQDQTGLWAKSRPDCIPSNGYDFGDLKTFAPRGGDLILAAQRAVTDHGYAMQMALAVEGAEHVLGRTASRCVLVFVSTSEPYEPVPILLDEEALYWAKVLNRHALDAAAHGFQTGEWPFRARELVTYSYPPSMLGRFGTMQMDGRLPLMERT